MKFKYILGPSLACGNCEEGEEGCDDVVVVERPGCPDSWKYLRMGGMIRDENTSIEVRERELSNCI